MPTHARHVLIAAVAGLSISMLPIQFDATPFDGAVAWAKDGNNGGGKGGGGGGGGGGRSADKGNSGNGGKGGNGGQQGSGGGKRQTSAAKSSGKAGSGGGLLKSLLRGNSGEFRETKASTKAVAKSQKSQGKARKQQQTAALPEEADIPAAKPEKNLNARLGSLNSLRRNVNAYLNSNSPRMAMIREYVMASAEAELAAEAVDAAQAKLDTALADLAADTALIETYNDFDYATASPEDLQARLDELEALDTTGFTEEQLAALTAEKEALLPAVQAAAEFADAEEAAADVVIPDLNEALEAAGNPNFVLDDEIVNWATEVLDGKIAEVKEILAAEAEEPVTPETEPVEPVEPVLPVDPAL